MSAPHVPDPSFGHRGQMFWLPPNGFGNGITASAWAQIADLTEAELATVLFALTEAHIAGYVATVRPRPREPGSGYATYRLWVDSLRYGSAEEVLMEVLRSRPST